jgi:hypothetical protein
MANAIIERRNSASDGAKVSAADLEAYAARLNRMNFNIAQGTHWFVNKRETPDGEVQRFLDSRKVYEGSSDAARPIHRAAKALSASERHPGHAD